MSFVAPHIKGLWVVSRGVRPFGEHLLRRHGHRRFVLGDHGRSLRALDWFHVHYGHDFCVQPRPGLRSRLPHPPPFQDPGDHWSRRHLACGLRSPRRVPSREKQGEEHGDRGRHGRLPCPPLFFAIGVLWHGRPRKGELAADSRGPIHSRWFVHNLEVSDPRVPSVPAQPQPPERDHASVEQSGKDEPQVLAPWQPEGNRGRPLLQQEPLGAVQGALWCGIVEDNAEDLVDGFLRAVLKRRVRLRLAEIVRGLLLHQPQARLAFALARCHWRHPWARCGVVRRGEGKEEGSRGLLRRRILWCGDGRRGVPWCSQRDLRRVHEPRASRRHGGHVFHLEHRENRGVSNAVPNHWNGIKPGLLQHRGSPLTLVVRGDESIQDPHRCLLGFVRRGLRLGHRSPPHPPQNKRLYRKTRPRQDDPAHHHSNNNGVLITTINFYKSSCLVPPYDDVFWEK